jgi:dienelactone hydrolase
VRPRQLLYRLLGHLPPRRRRVSCRTIEREERPLFTLEKLLLDLNGIEPVPAWFILPRGLTAPAPAILYHHYHAAQYHLGKDELLLAKPEQALPSWAESLARQGYCVLCIDAWTFGERSTRTEMDTFKHMLWNGQVLWGMMVYDALRALDILARRPAVDPARIGTLGMSMGSTMAWWIAALDERIKVCVDLCCLTDYEALIESGRLEGHGIYYYVPSLLRHFTAGDINALIAPRAHLALAGTLDPLTPPAGLDRIDAQLREVYARGGHPERWLLKRYRVGHVETPAMRREALRFLHVHL